VLANDTDVDLTDTHEVVGVVAGAASGVLSSGVGTTINGTYGWLVLNANGTWTYTLDNARTATDALAQDAHASDIFSYTESDHHGGTSTTTLTIDITGANDAPTLAVENAGRLTDTAVTDSFPTLTGILIGTDVDSGETGALTYAVLDATSHTVITVAGHYGSLTVNANGTYSYVADATAINALCAGTYARHVHSADHGRMAHRPRDGVRSVTGANARAVTTGPLVDTAGATISAKHHATLVGNDLDSDETAMLLAPPDGASAGARPFRPLRLADGRRVRRL
jgi:VCBS repeat-containing protein